VRCHQLASGLVTSPALAPEDAGPAAAVTADTSAVFGQAAAMAKTGGAGSGAQGLPNPFQALWSGGKEVLRSMSYYEMKNRAGVIGQSGLGPLLGSLAPAGSALRVHLMGHSFGARLVSFALTGLPASAVGAASPVKSLSLIQGAFSHFSFARPTPCSAVPAARWRACSTGSTGRCCPRSPRPTVPWAGGTRPPACWPTRTRSR
jgi:hypothetical protein